MINVTLHYYAQLREQARTSDEQLGTSASSLRDLYDELRARHGFTLAVEVLKVAVNGRFSEWDVALRDGDAVVFIPPVAGG
jgi:MoaD family protein